MSARDETAAGPREISIPVAGGALSALIASGADPCGAILAIHGGGYTGRYFHAPGQSFLEFAAAAGYCAAAVDRPGYGALRDRPMPFDAQVEVLGEATPELEPAEAPSFAALYEQAVEALLARRHAEAYVHFEAASRLVPDDPVVVANLSRLRAMGHGS